MSKLRRYAVGDRIYVQAQRIWLVLTGFVSSPIRKPSDPETITYGELAVAMGMDPRAGVTLGRQLGIVGRFCLDNDLPALNAIVVNAETGFPGDYVVLSPGKTARKEQKAVLVQDWYEVGVPTTSQLRKVWEGLPYR
jgi:hypothetical protein